MTSPSGRIRRAVSVALIPVWISLRAVAAGITNGGFEAPAPAGGWEIAVYGARPAIGGDTAMRHEGAQSLRVEASEPSDTALAQEVAVSPGHWYRFSAWVRTRGLEARDARVLGAVQVQRPGGTGGIASSPSVSGDTEWRRAEAYFLGPPDGRVRLCLFFAGFGKATGTVWFDEARLDEVNPSSAPLRINAAAPSTRRINPMQYGQFVEYLCDLVPSMWSEQLFDNSFEGLGNYNVVFIKQTDFKEKPWHPSGAVHRGRYSLDASTKVSGSVSQKIEAPPGEPATLGIAQDGLWVEKGHKLSVRVWLRQEGVRGPVRAALRGEQGQVARCEFRPDSEWHAYTGELVASKDDPAASFHLEFQGPGTLWVDNISLMPAHKGDGWRADVTEALRALKPRVIRFGGSALDEPGYGEFQWTDTIGDPDKRRPFHAWGGSQPTGPGLEEFVRLCREVDAEPLLCVRYSGRKPADAAAEVEYFNGAATTPMGAKRAANGHPAPYGVRLWQVGNERESPDYEKDLPAFCDAMKAVDPSIKLLSSFPTEGVLRAAANRLDYVCPHHYTPDLDACASDFARIRSLLGHLAPDGHIKVAVTEWNTTAGDWGLGRATLMTLGNALACSRYHNLLHRNADLVEIANRSNLINSFGSGIIQVNSHNLYRTPTWYAQNLYANHGGDESLDVVSEFPPVVGLDVSATRRSDTGEIVLFVVNDSTTEITRPVEVVGAGAGAREVKRWTLADRESAGERDLQNSFFNPVRVSVAASSFRVTGANFSVRFPALSLTVLRWRP
jgi:alpha-L-arabinofuranosidase